jgi:hypothetical protein
MTPTSDQATLPARRTAGGGVRLPTLGNGARRLLGLVWPQRRPAEARAYRLGRDATLALRPGPAGLSLTCESGVFLVTQEGDLADHVLEAGATFRTEARGLVVAWALGAGVLVGPDRR